MNLLTIVNFNLLISVPTWTQLLHNAPGTKEFDFSLSTLATSGVVKLGQH